MILQQEKYKQHITMIKNCRIFLTSLNCVSMHVITIKCVSKIVNCVSARVTGQMRENHAICVRVRHPDNLIIIRQSSKLFFHKQKQPLD